MAGSVTSIISSGFDAFTNLYDVIITWPGGGGGRPDTSVTVRALDFQPPELNRGQYESHYKIASVPRLNAKIEGAREINLTFRVDAAYNLHQNFLAWKHMWTYPSGDGNLAFQTSASAADGLTSTSGYGKVEVRVYVATTDATGILDPLDSNSAVAERWIFYDVICTKAGSPSLSREGSNAVTINPTFIFGRYEEPSGGRDGNSGAPGGSGIPPLFTNNAGLSNIL